MRNFPERPCSIFLTILPVLIFAVSTSVYGSGLVPFSDLSEAETAARIGWIGTGGVMVVESLALLIGMNLPRPSAWSTPENLSFAISDVLIGGGLVVLGLFAETRTAALPVLLLSAASMISHGWRSYSYLRGDDQPFCANTPLFVMNNLRLAGCVFSFSMGIVVSY